MIVRITDDFNLDKITDSGQCFRWTKTDDYTYRIIAGESCLYITELADDRYDLSCSEEEYDNKWEDYFDLREDYRSIRERIDPGQDPFLQKAAESEKGIRILRQDPWEMLITFIISQNKNIPAIRRCVELLRPGLLRIPGPGRNKRPIRKQPRLMQTWLQVQIHPCSLGIGPEQRNQSRPAR